MNLWSAAIYCRCGPLSSRRAGGKRREIAALLKGRYNDDHLKAVAGDTAADRNVDFAKANPAIVHVFPEFRVWAGSDGQRHFEVILLGVIDDGRRARLQQHGGKIVERKLAELCEVDQRHIAGIVRGQKDRAPK
jgi:hypothetical protein